jgi:hypothetical protein
MSDSFAADPAYQAGIEAHREMVRNQAQYNGWTNYETWAVGMYLDGNYTGEGTYRAVLDLVREQMVQRDANQYSISDVADALQAWFDDEIYNDSHELSGIVGDLLKAALDEVEWRELAEHKIAEVSES